MATRRPVYRFYDPRSAVGRIASSLLVGATVAVLLDIRYSHALSLLGGWNAGGLLLAALAWIRIYRFDPERTALHAAGDDPGRTAVYVLVLLTSAASLLAATVLVRHGAGDATETREMLALCLSTVVLSWTLTHTAFTLRYAHLYYRDDSYGVGGVEFPGDGKPCYSDFAYLAFTVGMCFQVSDTSISSRQIRRAILLHAAISFFYNTAILAFVLNLVFGHAT